jgi:hypothetical protein
MCSFESRQTHRGDGVLPGGRGECIVALDADVIPEAHWLRSVTAYLVDKGLSVHHNCFTIFREPYKL